MKKDGLPEKARAIIDGLKLSHNCQYDEKDSIGKRYRRQDALGTPFCITIDHETLENNTVTIRYRDSRELDFDAEDREIHGNYNRWVDLLSKGIQNEFMLMPRVEAEPAPAAAPVAPVAPAAPAAPAAGVEGAAAAPAPSVAPPAGS